MGKYTRMFDNIGNKFYSNEVQLGNYMKTFYVDNRLVTDKPILATVSFKNISSQVNLITFLEILCFAKDKYFIVQFRDILITD